MRRVRTTIAEAEAKLTADIAIVILKYQDARLGVLDSKLSVIGSSSKVDVGLLAR
jgi:hypothetical protein